MPLYEHLKNHPFTLGMTEAMLRKLTSFAHETTFEPEEVVFRARDGSRQFCLITAGSFRVELGTPVYAVLIQSLGAGEVFGWSTLLDFRYRFFQVRSQERSRVICLDGARLAEVCARDPKLAALVYRGVAQVAGRRILAIELRLAEFCGAKSQAVAAHEIDPPASSSAA
ncbi:MAG: cyclic nucleotide-binding domain-containing protein [Bryobacteraceae bacterium]|nr:cyclic nucleotide-binding domain-containing protein [Bryobacteraceae bacterium]